MRTSIEGLRLTRLLICICVGLFAQTSTAECVVLLHGLARSEGSMAPLEKVLQAEGFHVVNIGYPSRKYPIAELTELAIPPALAQCPKQQTVHFVTHSLGGIIIRYYLAHHLTHYSTHHTLPELGRVVMLGPPNKGSETVDKLGSIPGFQLINGPAGMQLGTSRTSVPNDLNTHHPLTKPAFDIGIIAGTQSINPILSLFIPNPDDGKVSVESTKLQGMSDHLIMPVTHTFMMRNQAVIEQVLYFLRYGHFRRHTQQDLQKNKSLPAPELNTLTNTVE